MVLRIKQPKPGLLLRYRSARVKHTRAWLYAPPRKVPRRLRKASSTKRDIHPGTYLGYHAAGTYYFHMLPRIVGIGRGTSSHDAVLSEGSPALQIPVVETID